MSSTLRDEEKIALFREMARNWENKNWRACADMFTVDGVLQSMMKEPTVGRENFYQRMVGLASPGKSVKLHIHRIGVVEGAIFHERDDEIIIDGVGRKVPVVGVLEFDGPLISLWRDYYDRGQFMWAQRKTEQVANATFVAPGQTKEKDHG